MSQEQKHINAGDAAVLSENPTLEELNAFFSQDRFATEAAGCRIISGSKGHSVVEMDITPLHRNAMGNVMGGAIYTIADFASAVAANTGEAMSVSVMNTIEYISSSRGNKLIATCHTDRSGRRIGYYLVEVVDDNDKLIAKMMSTCAR